MPDTTCKYNPVRVEVIPTLPSHHQGRIRGTRLRKAIEKVCSTANFGCWKFYDEEGDFKHEILVVRFQEAPRELTKGLSLLPDQPDGGYKVHMVP